MAQNPSFFDLLLEPFKHEIGYESLLEKLPLDKRVFVDWKQLLKEFKDTEGTTWQRKKRSDESESPYFGSLFLSLKSSQGTVNIDIHSSPRGQKGAIEEALHNITLITSLPEIPYPTVYQPCFADFCLAPRDLYLDEMNRFDFVYGNIYIKLKYSEYLGERTPTNIRGNVLPLARALHAAMQKAAAANPEGKLPNRPTITYTVNPPRVKVGETFTVTAQSGGAAQFDPRTFNVAQHLISNNIEYQETRGADTYKFIAKTAGVGTAVFSLFDKKTLWIFTDTVTVHIDPAK